MAKEKSTGERKLSTIIGGLQQNLTFYKNDARTISEHGTDNTQNEWLLQIAEIYKAAYGEELDLNSVIVD